MELSATWRPIVITVYPETPAPALRCPQCDVSLVYSATALGSREQLERWDRLECHNHGAFVYRHRTRKLRPDSQASKQAARSHTMVRGQPIPPLPDRQLEDLAAAADATDPARAGEWQATVAVEFE